jgi:uncharacterized membrane-anchored protein
VELGVPYAISTALYGAALALVFASWWRVEATLSIHDITTTRRELFYWAAVVATFAMGTALGDFTATTLGWGYATSIVLFAALIAVPALGYRFAHWNAVFSFWCAYVLTRPLGASVADWLAKPPGAGGRGWGAGTVSAVFGLAIVVLVAYLTYSRADAPDAAPATRNA